MSVEIKVPVLPESVSDATVAKWYKKPGDPIKQDEHLVDIETDKVVLEVVAPKDGTLEKILKEEGSIVKAEELIGLLTTEVTDQKTTDAQAQAQVKSPAKTKESAKVEEQTSPIPTKIQEQSQSHAQAQGETNKQKQPKGEGRTSYLSPSERRKLEEQQEEKNQDKTPGARAEKAEKAGNSASEFGLQSTGNRIEKRVPMTRLRAKIAERMIEAQQTAAILTTFNEVNMQPVMELRKKYKNSFEKNYGVRLGLMSFFTMAVIEALKHFPIINASVDGNDIVYHGYYDIGIAVASPRGLVVPVLRNAENMTMDEIEKNIANLAKKAESGHLSIEEITGGTFTITNGGVFGSLMATPILNPPQSGILGMHKIEERPIVEKGEIVIRPMMYIALSYDHRIIDGAESVKFLVMVKELLEDPARLALGI